MAPLRWFGTAAMVASASLAFMGCGDSSSAQSVDATTAAAPTASRPTKCRRAIETASGFGNEGQAETDYRERWERLRGLSFRICTSVAQYKKAFRAANGFVPDMGFESTHALPGKSICDGVDMADIKATPPPIDVVGVGDPAGIESAIDTNIGTGETDYGAVRGESVDCQTRSCIIHYNADTPVYDAEGELLDGTRPIFQAAFENYPKADVQINVGGQTTSVGGKSSTDDVMTITCSPSANKQIDWSVVDAGGLKALCEYQPLVTFG